MYARPRCEGPCRSRADERYELAAAHLMTSAARASVEFRYRALNFDRSSRMDPMELASCGAVEGRRLEQTRLMAATADIFPSQLTMWRTKIV
jgi:hypothetical protein